MRAKPKTPLLEIAEPMRPQNGFTLLELATVIVLLAFLTCLLASGLGSTRTSSPAFQCMNNLRQLGYAWQMYADDNDGRLVLNRDGAYAGQGPGHESWVAGWLDLNAANTDNTNTAMLVDHQRYPYGAYFGQYVNSAQSFRCPADPELITIAGQQTARARSYSMDNCFGNRMWTSPSRYTLYTSMSQLKHPVGIFVLVEERCDSINDGCFFTDPDTQYKLVCYPAFYHDLSCNFFFADGHTELHRWKDPRTTPALLPGYMIPLNLNIPGDVDLNWLQQHASELQ